MLDLSLRTAGGVLLGALALRNRRAAGGRKEVDPAATAEVSD